MAAVPGVERRFADQAVNPGFCAQPTEGVVPGDVHGCALDAGDFARGAFDEFALETPRFAPAQIHAQQHFGPVLGFGPTGARLDIEERTGGVHLTAEHALELQICQPTLGTVQIRDDSCGSLLVVLLGSQLQEFSSIGQAPFDAAEIVDDALEIDALAAESLGTLGIIPDVCGFELALDLYQTIGFGVVVKDTP
jgi:hypothetical protein